LREEETGRVQIREGLMNKSETLEILAEIRDGIAGEAGEDNDRVAALDEAIAALRIAWAVRKRGS